MADELDESLAAESGDVTEQGPTSEAKKEEGEKKAPEKKAGPSIEDLAKELTEVKSEIGKKAKEIGDVRQELAYERELRAQLIRDQQRQQAPPPEDQAKFDIEQPEASIDKRVDQKLMQVLTYQQQQAKLAADARAQKNYYAGMKSVDMTDKLYKGIEQDVQNLVYYGYQGKVWSEDDLDKAKTWDSAARIIRSIRDGWVLEPPEDGSPQPMKGRQTGEKPSASRRDEDDEPINLGEKDNSFLKALEREGLKLSSDDAKKIVRSERAASKRR